MENLRLKIPARGTEKIALNLNKAPAIVHLFPEIPGGCTIGVTISSDEPFSKEIKSETGFIYLEKAGKYSLLIENRENYEVELDFKYSVSYPEKVKSRVIIYLERLGKRTTKISIEGRNYIEKKIITPLSPEARLPLIKSLLNWASLQHPQIPRLVEINLVENYYIAEFVEGVTLEDYIQSKISSTGGIDQGILCEIFEIATQVLEILDYAKSMGLVHGDLYEGNIIIQPEERKAFLVDWETCSRIDEEIPPYLFKSKYQPPELVEEHKFKDNSDVYSLGYTLAYLVGWTGGPGQVTIHPALLQINGEMAKRIGSLISELTEKDHAKRPSISDAKSELYELRESLCRR
jgi:serine/threonine protein kinase